jgi:spore maturation protein B
MSVLNSLSLWAVPAMLALIPLWGAIRGVKVYDAFVEEAEEGLQIAVKIIPFLIGMLMALSIFRASGAMELLARAVTPLTSAMGFPPEVLPLMIVRPLSGAGALGVTADLLKSHSPDSYVGRLASIMQGSTDTTFYVLTVYFGAVGIRKVRYSAAVGIAADIVGFLAALWACDWFFR